MHAISLHLTACNLPASHRGMLRSFRLEDASCFMERDVRLVHGLIDVMWSSSAAASDGKARFEAFVRHELAEHVEAALGARTRLPYVAVLLAFLPLLAICMMLGLVCDPRMFVLWGFEADATWDEAGVWSWLFRWGAYAVLLWAAANPTATCCVQAAHAWGVDRGHGALTCVAFGTLVYSATLWPLVGLIIACVMYRPQETAMWQLLGGSALLGLLTIACWRPPHWLMRVLGQGAAAPAEGRGAQQDLL